MKKFLFALNAAALVLSNSSGGSAELGKTLPAWHEGELDIHFISTGRGECTYQILPDGTTFLVDASGSLLKFGEEKYEPLPSKPSDDISSGKVIVDYINHFAPAVSGGHIDYFLLTHHHGDHMGYLSPDLPMHESGLFRLSSLPEIGSSLVMDTILDRDSTDFSYPTPASQNNGTMRNYKAFLDWTQEANGSKVEKWQAGSRSQVVPVHDSSYGVTVQSYSGSGRFWTGEGEESFLAMPTTEEYAGLPADAVPSENNLSCSYILTYGDFDFFLGGDMQYNMRQKYPYMDADAPVSKVVHKVEVMKANHHGETETHDPALLAVLRPDVWLVGAWRDRHPQASCVDRVLAANPDCDIFCTGIADINLEALGEERLSKIASRYGHIVVRVAPGGHSFMVYTLEDSDQNYTVKSIHGPYSCTE